MSQDKIVEHPTLTQELGSAEYLASREIAALGGFWLEFAQQLGEIQQQQLDWWLADLQQSAEKMVAAQGPVEVIADHLQRRLRHTLEGTSQVANLWSKELDRSLTLHRRLWRPFFDTPANPRD